MGSHCISNSSMQSSEIFRLWTQADLMVKVSPAVHQRGLGQITWLLWASVSLSENRLKQLYVLHRAVESENEVIWAKCLAWCSAPNQPEIKVSYQYTVVNNFSDSASPSCLEQIPGLGFREGRHHPSPRFCRRHVSLLPWRLSPTWELPPGPLSPFGAQLPLPSGSGIIKAKLTYVL